MAQRIQIINHTSRIRDARCQFMIPGLQAAVSQDFAPKWGPNYDATLEFVGRQSQPDPTAWKLWLKDRSDQPGDLGYHDDPAPGIPEGFVFVEDDLRYGSSITVTVSHELFEMLGDPTTTSVTAALADGNRYAIEVCDPVEADELGYVKEGVTISDFVFPSYFGFANADGSPGFDFTNHLTAGCPQVTQGGYLLYLTPQGVWQNTMARHEDGSLSGRAIRSAGRVARRAALKSDTQV